MNPMKIEQTPRPGTHLALCRGDTLEFHLHVPHAAGGTVWLRTNLGAAATARAEMIDMVEQNRSRLARDWRDWPMSPVGANEYAVTVPITEIGHFEAKAFYLKDAAAHPQWPDGENVSISVSPSHMVAANGIYNGFVRQFGAARPAGDIRDGDYDGVVDARESTVLGPSGTFRDVKEKLDLIFDRLGCRYLLLLPIHPVPAVYGRMGLYGSPYAATDFFAVEPALAQFDRFATPMQQFQELVDAVHHRNGYLLLDVALNHCGWGSTIHARHPHWVLREPDGAMRSPGAWGVTWHDLTALDFDNHDVWRSMADMMLFWCRHGVDGFRCDAGYMIPYQAWEYIIAKIRDQYPDTVFMLEGLGGKISVTRRMLQKAGFDCAYSELFQQYTREQLESYMELAHDISRSDGMLVNFAETHDNNRLAAQSLTEARLRTALAALLSHQGAFAFANGVEWFATEKIDVHGNSDLQWGASVNQVDAIGRLNRLLRVHPAFFYGMPMHWVNAGDGNTVALLRGDNADRHRLLILANLDTHHAGTVTWDAADTGIGGGDRDDLLRMQTVSLEEEGGHVRCRLDPGQVLCLPGDCAAAQHVLEEGEASTGTGVEPGRVLRQRAKALMLALTMRLRTPYDCSLNDPDGAAQMLLDNPLRTIAEMTDGGEDILVRWQWPRDVRRHVVVPPGHLLFLTAADPFRAELRLPAGQTIAAEPSLPAGDGTHFAMLSLSTPSFRSGLDTVEDAAPHRPEPHVTVAHDDTSRMPDVSRPEGSRSRRDECRSGDVSLLMRVFSGEEVRRDQATVRFLPSLKDVYVSRIVPCGNLPERDGIVLRTNRLGGMMRAATHWGEIASRYDALLAANVHPDHPVDRHVMLTRYRVWVEYRGHSHSLDRACLTQIDNTHPQAVCWRFSGPFAPPDEWILEATLEMDAESNALRLQAVLLPTDSGSSADELAGPMDLVVRPDIEDRNFHEDTLAYTGPEPLWEDAVHLTPEGFDFSPSGQRMLRLTAAAGTFVEQPEWQYQVPHPVEAARGMQPAADLFSPGYFRVPLQPLVPRTIDAVVLEDTSRVAAPVWSKTKTDAVDTPVPHASRGGAEQLLAVLHDALQSYIVRRGKHKTIIAGYPWFLDWGRDTLIVARGLISAGMHREVEAIVSQFALFEEHGTLPNMIRGDDARDRDTSDAPLWFVKVCAELVATGQRRSLLEKQIGGRSLLDIVRSIVEGYRSGTPNGIRVDAESGLVYSPAHFTWMDTNFPAATPRQGYPVEIQALWHAALRFLADVTDEPQWRDAASQVRESIMDLYYLEQAGYFSDCLHARQGQPACEAEADDALRPNQLFLLTFDVLDDLRLTGRRMLTACNELVVPGGLRSLADRPLEYPLPVSLHGTLLNDPKNPYQGRYEGDEDTRRKPAYHNGTAWVWLYPSYAEAWWKTYGYSSQDTVLAYLGAVAPLLREGCLLQLPELLDGDAPHRQKGCDAQAWSISECYRVLKRVLG